MAPEQMETSSSSEIAEHGEQQINSATKNNQAQPDHSTSVRPQGHSVTAKRPNRPSF